MNNEIYELTNPQKSIWLTEQYFKGSCVNNLCGTVAIDQIVNFDVLRQATYQFVKDNDSFRLKLYYDEKGEVKQKVTDFEPFEIEIVDVKDEEELISLENEMVNIPFSILNSNLHHLKMYRLPNGKGGLIVVAHHLICDACTASLIASKIINIYTSLLKSEEILESPTSYINYINSENDYLISNKFQKDKEYWNTVFETVPEIGNIPSIKKENKKSCKAARKSFILSKEQVEKINTFCSENKFSAFNFFMALYAIYVGKVCGLDDFVLGTPILNRSTFVEKNTPGMFISTVPFRFTLTDGLSFIDFAKKIAFDSLGMFRHQKYPYQNILEDIRKKNPSQPNLYDILISYQNTRTNRNDVEIPYEVRWTFNHNLADSMQIHLFDMNDEGLLNISYDYRLDKYDEENICAIHDRICYMMEQVLNNNNLLAENIEIVTPKEKSVILNDFNNTSLEYDKTKTIIDYFEEQVEKTPNNVALVFENKILTYKELNEKINSLAHILREKGIKNNSIVGIMINRSFEMIISLLAVLKSGGAYIPIDPEYPEERISYMLENSNCQVLLSENCLKEKIKKINFSNALIFTDLTEDIYNHNFDNLQKISKPDDLSYLIYTSGSTGMPKGVMLTHKNLNNFYNSMLNTIDYLKDGKYHSIISITTVSFDIFAFETIISLTRGLKLFITNNSEQKMTLKLEKLLLDNNIEILQTTPSIMNFHLESAAMNGFSNLKYIMLAGEQLPKQLVNKIKSITSSCTIYNGYGPSETTIFSTVRDVTNLDTITIGRPIHNTQIYILDNNLNVLPQGTPGEIYIAGDGVGRGYLNNNELTLERYLKNPFLDNSIIYKTGDIGIWLENGEILCRGRSDNQVKLRGLRIELGEIENKINNFNTDFDIKSAVIIKNVNGKDTLNAFISSNTPIDINDLEKHLLNYLPIYMIPNSFTILDKLPSTPNGKIDRKALNSYSINTPNRNKNVSINVSPTEIQLIEIISKLIGVDSIDIEDSFFSLGLDSLIIIKLATILTREFNKEISIRDIYESHNIKNLAKFIEETNYIAMQNHITKSNILDLYPLSSAQKRIYYANELSKDTTLYNLSGAVLVNSILDRSKIINSFNQLLHSHDIFRTSFVVKDGVPYQSIKADIDIKIDFYDNPYTEKNNIIDSFPKPFDLSNAPLIRVCVHRLDNKYTLLLIDTHHIIMDGSSLNILVEDFFKLYNDNTLPKQEITYADYSVWENDYINSDKIDKAKNYWRKKFENYDVPVLNLPYDYSHSSKKNYSGNSISLDINDTLFKELAKLADKNAVSLYVIFLSALYILIYKYTNQCDFTIGSPIEGRHLDELKHIIGMFTDNIVLRQHIESEQSIRNLFTNVHNAVIDSLDNQPYPYSMIADSLNSDSLLNVVLTYQNAKSYYDFGELHAEIIHANTNTSKFNLLFEIIPDKQIVRLEYNSSLFKDCSAESILNHYIYILEQLIIDSKIYINDIDIITPNEQQLLDSFNDTSAEIGNDTAISLFEKQVAMNPNNIALFCDDKSLTYQELNDKSNSLACYLISKGIKPNDIVCIMTNRSLETIICMLGILKSGAAFFNVDPTYPIERTQYYLEDSHTHYVLTQKCLKDTVSKIENCIEIDLDIKEVYETKCENPNVKVSPSDLSYLIYTSGSTGTPKGVMLNQIGFANMCKAMTLCLDYLKEGNKHTIASVTSTPFDIFVYEIIVSLTHGMRVVMANNAEHRNPKLLDALIKKYNVDVMTVTPSLMKINYDNREPDSALALVKNMVFGGEPLPEKFVSDLKALADDITIYNIYGPSEITVLSNVQNLDGEKEITIGPPILNTQIHILDKDMKQVPIGVVGEIYIAGIQVGNGYMGKPELTSERFLDNSFGPGKMYKSGDLGKWTFDGKVKCLGRIDNQVKLHGLRIELGEIENALTQIDEISSSVVDKVEVNNNEVLCAYYVSEQPIDESFIRSQLRKQLPNYMIPTYFVYLKTMPYTLNRKIDRKALPLPTANKAVSTSKVDINTLSSTEEKLLQIWKDILKLDNIEITDNFFDIGGDSIAAINMQISAIKYGLNFEYADIFNHPTIKQLSQKIPDTENAFIKDYNYSTINTILQRNNINNISTITTANIKSILLIGSTGYLGAHLIDSILKNTDLSIYCLIRKKEELLPIDRIKSTIKFYFGDEYLSELDNRLHVVQGDITQESFGLSDTDYKEVFDNIDVVLNSGAIVKHFGQKDEFEKINVLGTQNIINICKKEKKRLVHISTISVSGNGEKEEMIDESSTPHEKTLFKEDNLYVGQNLKGIYAITKYKAELLVLESINKGLDAQILRIGNITNRWSDGVFQRNINDNAFARRFKSFIKIGAIPDYLLKHAIEFTPVDLCADAIVSILMHNSICNVFHIYNPNLLAVSTIYTKLLDLGINISPISDKLMSYIITGILNTESDSDIVSGIVQDLTPDKKLIYTSKIRLDEEFTLAYLNAINFKWQKLDVDYIEKYINYLKNIKFID